MKIKNTLARLSDDELLRRLSALLQDSRRVEAELIAHIAEVDQRRLYAREAASSMHVYCTEVLHLSDAEAYLRITVARASRKHPTLLDVLADGRLQLSGIERLAPHLTAGNEELLLRRATHRSRREIEELVTELRPRPDVPSAIRKVPVRSTHQFRPEGVFPSVARHPLLRLDGVAAPVAASSRPPSVQPLAPERYKVQFTRSPVRPRRRPPTEQHRIDVPLAQCLSGGVRIRQGQDGSLPTRPRHSKRVCGGKGRACLSRRWGKRNQSGCGRPSGDRTLDPRVKSPVLYR